MLALKIINIIVCVVGTICIGYWVIRIVIISLKMRPVWVIVHSLNGEEFFINDPMGIIVAKRVMKALRGVDMPHDIKMHLEHIKTKERLYWEDIKDIKESV